MASWYVLTMAPRIWRLSRRDDLPTHLPRQSLGLVDGDGDRKRADAEA